MCALLAYPLPQLRVRGIVSKHIAVPLARLEHHQFAVSLIPRDAQAIKDHGADVSDQNVERHPFAHHLNALTKDPWVEDVATSLRDLRVTNEVLQSRICIAQRR